MRSHSEYSCIGRYIVYAPIQNKAVLDGILYTLPFRIQLYWKVHCIRSHSEYSCVGRYIVCAPIQNTAVLEGILYALPFRIQLYWKVYCICSHSEYSCIVKVFKMEMKCTIRVGNPTETQESGNDMLLYHPYIYYIRSPFCTRIWFH